MGWLGVCKLRMSKKILKINLYRLLNFKNLHFDYLD